MTSFRKYCSLLIPVLGTSLAIFCLFQFLYRYDNKYTAGPPYGKEGSITVSSERLSGKTPVYLIDGWELYPDIWYSPEDFASGQVKAPVYTFIGQYPNFSYVNRDAVPFGHITYRLRILLDQAPRILSLEIPELYTNYQIWIDGAPAAANGSGSICTFLSDGDTELIVQATNTSHYYSGMTYPPALGTPQTLDQLFFFRTLFYGFLVISTLTLFLFSCVLWIFRREHRLYLHFGIFCLCFCLNCLHPFILRMGINGTLWYVIEDTARLLMLVQAMAFCSVAAGLDQHSWYPRLFKVTTLCVCLLCPLFLIIIIPATGGFINLYNRLLTAFLMFSFVYLCLCTADGLRRNVPGNRLILLAGTVLGSSFFSNLIDNSHFEPVYTGWQMEYSGFLLVLIFGWLMVKRNRDILAENEQLFHHMEALVDQRTAELHSVLEERKSFFSDMAHNLKAPIAAIRAFTSLMREQRVSLNDDLMGYLGQIENQNTEMLRRVQALSALNAFDRINAPWETIDLKELLTEIAHTYAPEAEACGIYFGVQPPESSVYSRAQKEKLMILFENLIYNAFDFTPPEGHITIVAELPPVTPSSVLIRVSDTGCGIPPEHLPQVFDRFYTVREQEQDGSGLGLYMAKMTVEEIGGSIQVESEVGKGTVFVITLPLVSIS